MPTMAMTAPTPMMMPSMVRVERILLRARARKAIRNVESKSIDASSLPESAWSSGLRRRWHGLEPSHPAESCRHERQCSALRTGLTIILVTHEHDISQFAKRSIVFRDGTIRRDETVPDRASAAEVLKTMPTLED